MVWRVNEETHNPGVKFKVTHQRGIERESKKKRAPKSSPKEYNYEEKPNKRLSGSNRRRV